MDIKKISQRAQKARAREEKEIQAKKKDKAEQKINSPLDPFSFYVYSRIFPSGFRMILWIFFVLTIGTVCIFLYLLEDTSVWFLYIGLGLINLFFLRLIIEQLRKIWTYKTYKNFKTNLPFQLQGWKNISKNPDLLHPQNWSFDCSIEVILNKEANEFDYQKINDALTLFISGANKHFYKAWLSDGRKKWSLENQLNATGSADITVIGEMYTLVQDYLKSIHEKYPVVEIVKIIIDQNIGNVEPPPTTD